MNKLILIFSVAMLYSIGVMAQDPVFQHGFENHPDAVEVLNLSASPSPVFEGDTSTLSWELKDATSCTATGGTTGWRALTFDGSDGSFETTALATAGSYTFTLTCEGPVGVPAAATADVVVEAPAPVAILSFTAVPETVTAGQSVNLSWTLQDAVDCTPTSGSAQWLALALDGSDSSVEITDLNIEGVYEFALSCEGIGGDVDVASQDVTVESASACDAPTLPGTNYFWNEFWQTPDGLSFPRVGLSRILQIIFSKAYMSIQFNTGDVVDNGKFALINSTLSGGLRLGAISQCEGDFDVPAACTHTWGTGSGIKWATDDSDTGGSDPACALQPNTTYFLNLTYTDGSDPNSSNCDLSITGQCYMWVDYQRSR